MNNQKHFFIEGKVQGVFFRASTRKVAQKLQLTGFVRNLADGRVEVHAQGEEENLQKLLDWCYKGPIGAKVQAISQQTVSTDEKPMFSEFEIR